MPVIVANMDGLLLAMDIGMNAFQRKRSANLMHKAVVGIVPNSWFYVIFRELVALIPSTCNHNP
jgi:hypothetical protein